MKPGPWKGKSLKQIGQAVRAPTERRALVSKELQADLDLALVVNQRRSAPRYLVTVYVQSLACLMCLTLGNKIGEVLPGAIGCGAPLWMSAVDRQGSPRSALLIHPPWSIS